MNAIDHEPWTGRPTWKAALFAALVSIVLGITTLGRKALWFDEAFDANAVSGSWRDLLHTVAMREMSQAAYLVGLKLWVGLTSSTEVWLRIPSVVLAAIASALLVRLGSRMFDRTTGALAGVLFATNGMVVAWSQQARTYALVTVAVIVASYLLVRALDDPRRRNWLLYAVGAGASVYCHFFAGFVVVAHVASLPFAARRPPLRYVAEAGALFATIIAPALFFTATASREPVSWISPPTTRWLFEVIMRTLGWNGALAIAAAVGVVVLAHRAKEGNAHRRWQMVLLLGWMMLPFCLALVVSRLQPILVPQYAIVVTPAIALAAAVAIGTCIRARALIGLSVLALVVAISGNSILTWYQRVPEDWRGAAAFVARERRQGDALLVLPSYAIDAYRYYDRVSGIVAPTSERRSFFVVRGNPAERRTYAAIPAAYLAGHRLVSAKRFGRAVSVLVYERTP